MAAGAVRLIDVEALRAAFRRRAARFGIDPERGATSYQVALVKADGARRKRLDFLRYVPLPLNEASGARDVVEEEAWASIERQARQAVRWIGARDVELLVPDKATLGALWREVKAEMADRAEGRVPSAEEGQKAAAEALA